LRKRGVVSEVGAPVVVDGRVWGALIAGTDDPEPLPAGLEQRLSSFAELIATAISNATTQTELVASRTRIVEAADEQRRQVVRDLHDGAQQRLNESAGRQMPAGKRHGNKWLTAMLIEAAGSVGRMHGKNYLAVQHARLTKRRGMGRAQVAVAHSILVAAYWMLKRDEPYHDLGADWHSRRNDEAHTRRLIAQLEHLGHTVIIDPAA